MMIPHIQPLLYGFDEREACLEQSNSLFEQIYTMSSPSSASLTSNLPITPS